MGGDVVGDLPPGRPRSSSIDDQPIARASVCLIERLAFGLAVAVAFLDALDRREPADAPPDLVAANC